MRLYSTYNMRMTKLILIDDAGSLNSALLLRLRQIAAASVISILVCLGIYIELITLILLFRGQF